MASMTTGTMDEAAIATVMAAMGTAMAAVAAMVKAMAAIWQW